mgnify:CR=1 FL=1
MRGGVWTSGGKKTVRILRETCYRNKNFRKGERDLKQKIFLLQAPKIIKKLNRQPTLFRIYCQDPKPTTLFIIINSVFQDRGLIRLPIFKVKTF